MYVTVIQQENIKCEERLWNSYEQTEARAQRHSNLWRQNASLKVNSK